MRLAVSSCVLSLVGLFTCHPRHQERATEQVGASVVVGTTDLTSASLLVPATATARIAEARCDHEQVCINVGPHHRYPSREACVDTISAETQDRLDPTRCPRGIDAKELDRCLAAIRIESCVDPGDALDRLTACRRGNLCRK